MFRFLILLAALTVTLTVGAEVVFGQQWPDFRPDPAPGTAFRGSGFYLSWLKIGCCWLVFLCWVWTTDWVSQDSLELRLNYLRWNPIVFGSFMAAFVLLWLIPIFWLGFSLLAIAYVAPLTSYILYRNSQVLNDQHVLTPSHIRYWLAERLAKAGVKIEAEARDKHEKGSPVQVAGHGSGDDTKDRANLLAARQSPGLLPARNILAEGLESRGSALMLDYGQEEVALQVMIDGVWLKRDSVKRDNADAALEAMKILCGLNPEDRRSRQKGTFLAQYESIDYASTIACQGTAAGERVLIQFEDKKIRFDALDELGMRSNMQDQVKGLLAQKKGLLLFSAMPANGLRSTADVVIRCCTDRFTREFVAVEASNNRYEKIENCAVTTYRASKGQTPDSVLSKVFGTMPHVVVIRDLVNGETVRMICEEIPEERLFISTIRAKDSVEALLRVLALGVPPKTLAGGISAVFSQRLVRKLCEACKEAYQPTPQILKQLGIPKGRVEAFYRPPQEETKDVCEECYGIGYRGRTAIFELLIVGDTVRKVVASKPKLEVLRQAARKDGLRSLQEEGILLVAKGTTSLPELMRVLKQ